MQHRKSECEQLQPKPIKHGPSTMKSQSPEININTERRLFTTEQEAGDKELLTDMDKADFSPFDDGLGLQKPLRIFSDTPGD